ncbi:glycosyltransferase 87 family protein [Actinosynnema sp. NPDC020468]|uniref:glycosyltransferase 87 family protein n=1 Tax=Actinosynnema sp. NPDC020468 TaxID=3154488 RepID=UPI0034052505
MLLLPALKTPTRPVRSAAVAVVGSLALYVTQAVLWPGERWYLYDLEIYRLGGRALLDGTSLYTARFNGQPFTNTPFGALLFAGFALVPMDVARLLMTALTLAALGVSAWCAARLTGRALPVAAGAAALGLWLEPVQASLTYGQVNVVLMALVLLDFARPGRFQGVGIGLAAAVKLTPGLFVVYLLVTRRFRAAAVAAGTTAATVAVGFAVAPTESAQYWGGVFLKSSRIGGDVFYLGNQSLHAFLGRAGEDVLWLPAAVLVVVVGTRVALRLHRAGDELGGVLVCALTALLVSPISWHHHWVWCAPLLVRLWPKVALVVVPLLAWPLPGAADFPLPRGLLWIGGPFADLYTWLGVLALGLAWWTSDPARRRG